MHFEVMTDRETLGSDSLTRSRITDSDLSQTLLFALQQTPSRQIAGSKPQTADGATTIDPDALSPEIQAWVSEADATGNILSRGYYDYAASCGPPWKGSKMRRVEYALRIQGVELLGTCQDDVGHANIQGTFDPARNSVRFMKHYYAPKDRAHLQWEYVGCFTPCGIVGEWRYPGDPPAKALWRGKFGIWLQQDEDAKGIEFESQMELLSNRGQLLTRSMTGIS